jgi:hypothetical protein
MRCADHVTPPTRKIRHYFADSGGRSVGIVRLRTKATEFSLIHTPCLSTNLWRYFQQACLVAVLQAEESVSWPRFEPNTSRIKLWRVTAWSLTKVVTGSWIFFARNHKLKSELLISIKGEEMVFSVPWLTMGPPPIRQQCFYFQVPFVLVTSQSCLLLLEQ